MPRRRRRTNRWDLHPLIERALGECPHFDQRVQVKGRIERLVHGLSFSSFQFEADGCVTEELQDLGLVLRIIDGNAHSEPDRERQLRLQREILTLVALDDVTFPLPFPRFIAEVHNDAGQLIGMIETVVRGMSTEYFDGECVIVAVANAAAATHQLPSDCFPHLEFFPNRRAHVEARLAELSSFVFDDFAAANTARCWIEANMPDDSVPVRVLHGDLLPQNLLPTGFGPESTVGVVDWEFAKIGDPAYDFAIVNRANRKFAGVPSGLEKLLAAYRHAGGDEFPLADVRAHECLLLLNWLEDSIDENPGDLSDGHGPDHYVDRITSFLKRIANE